MKKIKYYYNTNTLRYEKLETPLRVKLLRFLGFISAALVTALILVTLAYRYFPSANEKILLQENENLQENFLALDEQASKIDQRLRELEKRDNEVYRAIFEANPIPDSARASEMEHQMKVQQVLKLTKYELESSIANTLNVVSNRIEVQDKSYAQITNFIKNKEE